MARKTKEIIIEKENENEDKVVSKTLTTKNTLKEKKARPKVKAAKKTTNKKETKIASSKKTSKLESKATVSKKATKSKVLDNSEKKEVSLNTSITSETPKVAIKKANLKKPAVFTPEYYDLPYRYNQTVVKILAQTPTNLFIYWDISDEDRENLKQTYGSHVFEITKPVLIVHNTTMNYSFEVDINDFANSWYLNINDSKCEYKIELGRRPIPIDYNYVSNYQENDAPIKPIDVPYIYISSSNEIESPNDRVLFNKEQQMVYFRNVKSNQVTSKDLSSLTFIQNMGRFYKASDLYKKFYGNQEILGDDFDLESPGFGNPSSGSLSSRFN